MLNFSSSTPEEQGISSTAISNFIQRLKKKNLPMHSFILMRNDFIVAEGYYKPYNSQTLHRAFSVVKSFVSLAVCLCEEDGLLSRNDRIISYFPEYCDKNTHPYIKEMTIDHMLMMRTCHASTTYKFDSSMDWIESFFRVKPTHKPGTVFHYDTSCAHTLCALVERLTGQNCLDYLKDKLAPLGLSKESYLLKDPFGHSQGGSGLVALPRDLLRFGYLLLHEGQVENRQLVSRDYIRKATSKLTATAVAAPIAAEANGYGYMFWRTERDGYVCYGMGGQLIIVLPSYRLICVTTADTQGMAGGNQLIYDALYEEIVDTLSDAALSEDKTAFNKLTIQLEELSIASLKGDYSTEPLLPFCQKLYYFDSNASGFQSLSFEKCEDYFYLNINGKKRNHRIAFGLGQLKTSQLLGYQIVSSGAWIDRDTFYIRSNIIDSSIGSIHFQFHMKEDEITIFIKKIEESLFEEFTGHFYLK